MDLFKFLKKKHTDSLDELFQKGVTDPAYIIKFIDGVLSEKLVVITNTIDPTKGIKILQKGLEISIYTFNDGRVPVFTSIKRIYDNGIIKQRPTFLEIKGINLFLQIKDKTVLLNPNSNNQKEFKPEEIERLCNRTFFISNQKRIEKDIAIKIKQPPIYPVEIVKSLSLLFKTRPEVKAGYLAWMHDPSTNIPPHYLFAIEVTGDWSKMISEAVFITKQILPEDEIADFLKIDHKTSLRDYFINQTKPFYIKET